MSNLPKKFLLSFLASLVVLFSFAPFFEASAQNNATVPTGNTPTTTTTTTAPQEGSWYNSSFSDWWSKVYDTKNPQEIFGERYTAAQVQWVIYSLFSFIINSAANTDVLSCVFKNAADLSACASSIESLASKTSYLPPAKTNESLASLVFNSNRPLSGISYVKERADKFSLIPVAHAQTVGFGFSALAPIQKMWSGFRDLAFGLFVIVAVIFAFMIMFRVKISPQVVITVQSAIPKIIMSLILVTFSYAIAGLLIDLMYVVIGLISLITAPMLGIFGGAPKPTEVFDLLTLGQPLGMNIQFGVFGLFWVLCFIFFLPLIIIIFALTAIVAALLTPIAPLIILGGALLTLVVMIIAIWMGIKTMWALLKAFANIVLLTIFAPIQIGLGTLIPNFGFGQWIKSYISHLSTFVVTGVLFLFSFIFIIQGIVIAFTNLPSITVIMIRPILGNISIPDVPIIKIGEAAWPPLLGGGSGGLMTGLMFLGVAFVLFTMIPKTTEVVQALLSGKPFAYGSAIGEAFGPASLAWRNTGGAAMQNWQRESVTWASIRSLLRGEAQNRFGRKKTVNTPNVNRDQSPDA